MVGLFSGQDQKFWRIVDSHKATGRVNQKTNPVTFVNN